LNDLTVKIEKEVWSKDLGMLISMILLTVLDLLLAAFAWYKARKANSTKVQTIIQTQDEEKRPI
jgi:hypothetical protein